VNALLNRSIILALAAAGLTAAGADTTKTAPALPVPERSLFIMPANAREGRDPFFPESSRLYEENVAVKHTIDNSSFSIKGLSIEHGRAMVIINNHTFAPGDEGDVVIPGGRVHLRLIAIRTGVVIIEVNGTRRELNIAVK
jgi:hypothetical protein